MKLQKRRILVVGVAWVLMAASAFCMTTIITLVNASLSLAAGISNITEYNVPGSYPWGIASDRSGRVWVALPGCDLGPNCPGSTPPGKLALFDPNTKNWVAIVSLPAGYGQPLFVAIDQNGKVWFTMPRTDTLGRYDPVSSTVSQWAVPSSGSEPWGIAIDPQGKIWFTEHYSNKIGSFDPVSQSFHEIATYASNSQPYGIAIDNEGNKWFTENSDAVASIGEYTNQGDLKEYKIRNTQTAGTGLTPHLITLDRNGNVWWSEGWASAIGMLNVADARPGTNQGVTEYRYTPSCRNCGSHTSGISVDGRGLVWFTDSLQDSLGSFPVQGGSFAFYVSRAHPHDGLNVDTQDRIWFTQEVGNHLVAAIQPTAKPLALAQDGFQRADQALWGNIADGQKWGGDANRQTAFSISNHAGLVSTTGGTVSNAVLGPVAAEAEVYMTGLIASFADSNFGSVLRWTNGDNWYKGFIDGSNLLIQKRVKGRNSTLASIRFAARAGTAYTLHFRVVGSTLTANVWVASSSEKSGWMVTARDSSLKSGQCGLRFVMQAKNKVTVYSFRANSLN
jgi:sugar lactone lactonase YvrE